MPINPQLWRCWTNVEGSVIFSPRKSHKGQQVAISTHFKKKSFRCLFSARWQLNRSTRCQIAVQTSVEYSKHLTWCCSILNTGTLWSVKCEDTLGENVFQSVSTSFQPNIIPGPGVQETWLIWDPAYLSGVFNTFSSLKKQNWTLAEHSVFNLEQNKKTQALVLQCF